MHLWNWQDCQTVDLGTLLAQKERNRARHPNSQFACIASAHFNYERAAQFESNPESPETLRTLERKVAKPCFWLARTIPVRKGRPAPGVLRARQNQLGETGPRLISFSAPSAWFDSTKPDAVPFTAAGILRLLIHYLAFCRWADSRNGNTYTCCKARRGGTRLRRFPGHCSGRATPWRG